jgi:hypothetical protein
MVTAYVKILPQHTSLFPTTVIAQLILMLVHVSAANCSHPQGDTNADMYSMLYRLSNINGNIFIPISVITDI